MGWQRRTIILILLAVAGGVTGCGRGSLLSSLNIAAGSAAPPMPRQKFLARADKFCREALLEAERNALGVVENKARLYIRHGTLDEFKEVLRQQEIATMLAPALRKRVERVRDFGVPAGERRHVGEIMQEIEEMAWGAERATLALQETNSKPVRHVRALARADGIERCAVLYDYHGLYDRGTIYPQVRLVPDTR